MIGEDAELMEVVASEIQVAAEKLLSSLPDAKTEEGHIQASALMAAAEVLSFGIGVDEAGAAYLEKATELRRERLRVHR